MMNEVVGLRVPRVYYAPVPSELEGCLQTAIYDEYWHKVEGTDVVHRFAFVRWSSLSQECREKFLRYEFDRVIFAGRGVGWVFESVSDEVGSYWSDRDESEMRRFNDPDHGDVPANRTLLDGWSSEQTRKRQKGKRLEMRRYRERKRLFKPD